MANSNRMRSNVRNRILATVVAVLSIWPQLAAPPSVEPPAAEKPTLSESERKKLLAKRDGFWKESQELQAKGNVSEALTSAEQMLSIERRSFRQCA